MPETNPLIAAPTAEEIQAARWEAFVASVKEHPNPRRRNLNPEKLVWPEGPESTRGGPVVLRWFRDEPYRLWEEAKALTARWNMSQRLASQAQDWLKARGLTAYVELGAVFKTEAAAQHSFRAYLGKKK